MFSCKKNKKHVVKVFRGDKEIIIELYLDRGGRIIDCTRIGRVFDKIYGRQFISLAGVNQDVINFIDYEVNIEPDEYFV